jgi:prepilin-type N-terminal cleavage/methylation domain-containing protein
MNLSSLIKRARHFSAAGSIRVHSRDSRAVSRFSGFSILELLVAMAVLAMLVVMVAQLVKSSVAVIAGSRKNLGADAQAREVFSRFSLDVAQMVKRPDVDAVFSTNSPGNKAMFFFSESPGFATTANNLSTLSLVGYRVGTNGVERLGKGLTWSGANSATFLTYANSTAATNTANALSGSTLPGAWSAVVGSAPAYADGNGDDGSGNNYYHSLATGVFRIEYCFQKKDGTYTLARDSIQGFRDVAAIILSLAVLDGDSRKIATGNPATVNSNLAAALPFDVSNLAATPPKLPAQLWQDTINNSATFAVNAGIPQAAASKVRIYQRAFPLNAP